MAEGLAQGASMQQGVFSRYAHVALNALLVPKAQQANVDANRQSARWEPLIPASSKMPEVLESTVMTGSDQRVGARMGTQIQFTRTHPLSAPGALRCSLVLGPTKESSARNSGCCYATSNRSGPLSTSQSRDRILTSHLS